jgi:membrane-bound lytic murein transglycosylase B
VKAITVTTLVGSLHLCLFLTLIVWLWAAGAQAEERIEFNNWLHDLRAQALAIGISPTVLNESLSGIAPIPRIIELDRNQPEFKLSLEQYLDRLVSQKRVSTGKKKLAQHSNLLFRISELYGVQPRFLVSFWGVETDYGRLASGFSTIAATATLAYDGRRSAFFRGQLLDALHILNDGHITTSEMRGSWAGAMGQMQFMPSTFRAFAVDDDGDGRIDIWNNLGDAFASAANYLAKSGWNRELDWGFEVELPDGFDRKLIGLKTRRRIDAWRAAGVRRLGGQSLPQKISDTTSIVVPKRGNGRAFLTYQNYRVILRWNRSHLFAIAIGTLADRIVAD